LVEASAGAVQITKQAIRSVGGVDIDCGIERLKERRLQILVVERFAEPLSSLRRTAKPRR